jgi:hypothetical protein
MRLTMRLGSSLVRFLPKYARGITRMARRPDQDARCAHATSCEANAIHVVDEIALCARHGLEILEERVLRVRRDLVALGVHARVGEGHLIARGRNLSRDEARQLLAKLHHLLEDFPEPVEELLRVC